MDDYLLDTNVLGYWYDAARREHRAVISRINDLRAQPGPQSQEPRLLISVITLGEMEYGYRVSRPGDPSRQDEFRKFVRDELPMVLGIDRHTIEPYADLRAWLFERYSPRNRRMKAKRVEELVDPATALELGIH